MATSAQHPSYQIGFFDKILVGFFRWLNKYVSWDKLPKLLGIANIAALRVELRSQNLYDGYADGAEQGNQQTCPMADKRFENARNSDGMYNSLELPKMGCAFMRFGRNFPREYTQKPTEKDLYHPNPRMLSEIFMTRKEFIPATSLNLLAAAWIQFQTHDWFFHESDPDVNLDIPLPKGDSWPHGKNGTMKLPKSTPDDILNETDKECPGYKNGNTAWWDASMIYGSSEKVTCQLRDAHPYGHLKLRDGRYLPKDHTGDIVTGFSNNWWIGMEILHTLFALEHNSICDALRKEYPKMTSDELFDKARLINCALMAKIHTVEWTPAIIAHPTTKMAMNVSWWGIAGETITKNFGQLSKNEVVSGIPGSVVDQFGVPYSLTEEFVSVYRLHALMPDEIAFFKADSGKHQVTIPVEKTLNVNSEAPLKQDLDMADVMYSFGINYPGAVVNFNYPKFFQNLTVPPDNIPRDMGTVDILRDRERGVPRYNQFRRLLHMPAFKTFEELTGGNMKLAQQLSDAYDGDIELVDTIIGSHSEVVPEGFGFSDTAFRVFILMAGRRLKSDRFIAGQFNEKTYTKLGLKWVQTNTMKDMLIRHYPKLAPALKDCKNAFAPWTQLPASRAYPGVETNAPKKK